MVPIRDPKLVGRKIDCPKCKYRFIVEEPADDVEEAEEEAPAKKGKAGANGTATKKPAAKGAAAKRRADDDQDMDDIRPKKKQGGSGMLIAGIVLAGVAIIALAAGAVFLFTDSGSDDPKPSRSRVANAPQAETEQKKEEPKASPPPVGPKPRHEDISNLLPNDAQFVLNMPLEHLTGNAKVNQALLKAPGSFHEGAFQRTWGVSPSEIRRVVLAGNVDNKTLFSVMRTSSQMKEKQIIEKLNLKPEPAINGLRYYLAKKPLDALSTVLLKGAFYHESVALHFMDPFTVICADPEPMKQFLQEKGQPKQLSKKTDEEEPKSNSRPGGPPGMMGGPPGGGSGVLGMPGGARGGMPPGPAMPGGGNRGPGGSGGFRPPMGMPPGMTPPGMGGESSGGADANAPAPFSSSYMTIDPHLKSVLDQVEKVDKTENQNVLLSAAVSTSALTLEHLKEFVAQAKLEGQRTGTPMPPVSEFGLKFVVDTLKTQLKAVGAAVTDYHETKISGNVGVTAADVNLALDWEKKLNDFIAGFLSTSGLDLANRNAGSRSGGMYNMNPNMPGMPPGMPNRPNMPGMPGMPGMPSPPRSPGGGSPNMPSPPRMPGGGSPNMPSPPKMPGGGGGMTSPSGGMMPPGMPGGFGGMQSGGGDEQTEKTGKDGNYGVWSKETVLALGLTYTLSADKYKSTGEALEVGSIYFRSLAAMSDRQSHIHELAAATQAYLNDKGFFPRGAVLRAPDAQRVLDWRPDQRLSWMTQILPYLSGGEFKDVTNLLMSDKYKDKSWYEEPNSRLGMIVVPQFVTPSKSYDLNYYVPYPNLASKGNELWAATHFVGIAGVGLDAAEYRADDPATAKKLGVFGYDRETKKADIKDGLNQTILLIQTPSAPKSPWIAGGGSTVRGVSEDLDCVQPFVCTEYQGKRGTFAIMADGKVRFIPATINPKTFQAMCTIAGEDKISNLEKEAPEVQPEETAQPELKTEQPAARPVVKKPETGNTKDWKEYTSKEGGFSVRMPTGKLLQQTQQVNTPAGKLTIHIYGVGVSEGTGTFITMYTDYPPAVVAGGADRVLDGAKSGVSAFVKDAKITHESKIKVAGNPGREWTIDLAGKGSMRVRVFLVKNRIIQLLAGSETGKVSDKDIQTFFDSFKLIEK